MSQDRNQLKNNEDIINIAKKVFFNFQGIITYCIYLT